MYDLIGDIHGCAQTLQALLEKLDYSHDGTCYRHPDRQVIFLGDFVDRGPFQRETIGIARAMTQHGAALAVMGNHEFNALAYHTPDPQDRNNYLRPHDDKNLKQHKHFLEAFANDDAGKTAALDWFRTLPLWLDLGNIRVIHACWHPGLMAKLGALLGPGNTLTEELLVRASRRQSDEFTAVETLLKGKEVPLPGNATFKDKDGHPRSCIRIRWWEENGNFRSANLSPAEESTIPEDEVPTEHFITYGRHEPPVFLGHYWLQGRPHRMADNVACLDYSVAKPGGQLVAYRWSGETTLTDDNFISVMRIED